MCLEHKQYWQCCLKIDTTYIDSCPLAAAGQRCRTEERVHPIGGYCASCRRAYNKVEDDVCTSPQYSRNDGYDRPWELPKPKPDPKPNPSLAHSSPSNSHNHSPDRDYSPPRKVLGHKSTPYAISFTRTPETPNPKSRTNNQSKEPSRPPPPSTSRKQSYNNRTSNEKYRPVKSQPLTFPTNYYSYPPPSSSSPRSKGHKQRYPPNPSNRDKPAPKSHPDTSKYRSSKHDKYSGGGSSRSKDHYYPPSSPKTYDRESFKNLSKSGRSRGYGYGHDYEYKHGYGGEYRSEPRRPTTTAAPVPAPAASYRVASPETVRRLVRDGVLPGWAGGGR